MSHHRCCCGGSGGVCCDQPGAVCGWDTSPQGAARLVRMSAAWNFTLNVTGIGTRTYIDSIAEQDVSRTTGDECSANYRVAKGTFLANGVSLDAYLTLRQNPLANPVIGEFDCDCGEVVTAPVAGAVLTWDIRVETSNGQASGRAAFAAAYDMAGTFVEIARTPCPGSPGCDPPHSGTHAGAIARSDSCAGIAWSQTVTNLRWVDGGRQHTLNGTASGIFVPYLAPCGGSRPIDPNARAIMDALGNDPLHTCRGCGQ